VCSDLSEVFDYLEMYDMLHVPAGGSPIFDNGFMVWKKGPAFDALVLNWLKDLNKTGPYRDDQAPLSRAAKATPQLHSGVLPPVWQGKFIPVLGERGRDATAYRTLVLRGPVHVVAGVAPHLCKLFNAFSSRPRIITYNRTGGPQRLVFSQEECENVLHRQCAQREIDWHADFKVMPKEKFVALYSENKNVVK